MRLPTVLTLFAVAACLTADDEPALDAGPPPTSTAARLRSAMPANIRVALVLYDFADTPVDGSAEATRRGTSHVSFSDAIGAILFGNGADRWSGSLAGWYHDVTDGRTTVTGTVFDWVRLPRKDHVWRHENVESVQAECARTTGDPVSVPSRLPAGRFCRDAYQPPNNTWLVGPFSNATTTCPAGTIGTPFVPDGDDWCLAPEIVDANLVPAINAAARGVVGFSSDFSTPLGFRPEAFDVVIYATSYGIKGVHVGGKTAFVQAINREQLMTMATHEVGHVLGLPHANRARCPSFGEPRACTSAGEYGDTSSMMGADNPHYFSGYEKLAIGALPASARLDVTASGRYVLPASELATATPRVLRIRANATYPGTTHQAYYYLDTRRPIRFDTEVGDWTFNRGLSLRLAPDEGVSFTTATRPTLCGAACSGYHEVHSALLIDAKPTTDDVADAAFVEGASYSDRATGVTLQVARVDDDATTIDVTFRPARTRLFFYGASAGTLRNAFQTAAGLIQLNALVTGASPNWTTIVGAHHGGMLWYQRGSGSGYASFVDANDVYHSAGAQQLTAGWTHLVPVGRSNFLFYERGTGRYTTADMASDGRLTERPLSGGFDSNWDLIAGTLTGWVVFYRADGHMTVGRLDGTGAITEWRDVPARAGFTAVASVRDSTLVFYNRASGAAQVVRLSDGHAQSSPSVNWGVGFDQIIGGGNGALLRYRTSDGATISATVDDSGVLRDVGVVTGMQPGLILGAAGGV